MLMLEKIKKMIKIIQLVLNLNVKILFNCFTLGLVVYMLLNFFQGTVDNQQKALKKFTSASKVDNWRCKR